MEQQTDTRTISADAPNAHAPLQSERRNTGRVKHWLGLPWIKVQTREVMPVIGSRRVVKYAGAPREGAVHFYGTGNDIWTQAGLPIAEVIPDNAVVYGEIIGWIGDQPIQPNYTYQVPKGEHAVYIYRVVVGGFDLSWDALKQFCEQRGLKHVPELGRFEHGYFIADPWLDTRYRDSFPQAVPLDPSSPCDEGVTVRAEGITPVVLKAKSPLFLVHESKASDKGQTDTEEDQA